MAIVAGSAAPAHATIRHALLIGINDYSTPGLREGPAKREVPNLDGAVNDVRLIGELLVALYGFKPADIVTLTDQQATRSAILKALDEQLVQQTRKGDIVLFYFSGHGSQVRNSLSREADRLDESILPADSRRGAPDIRDKELLPIFNQIIDRGGRLTIILDTCHSGSGTRDPRTLHRRGVSPDLRDVADPSSGPAPERRGALVLAAAQDFDLAFETLDEQKIIRGAFTWALARAMRDADPGEPASETFLRAEARLHAERPAQEPVLAGSAEVRGVPLFGGRTDRRARTATIAVERPTGAETYLLQGGWANGITVGSELRLPHRDNMRLEVTSLVGVARSTARVTRGEARIEPGALLEIVTWAAPPSPPLRVWAPRAPSNELVVAKKLRDEASQRGIRWVDDPTEVTPTHLLLWNGQWELVANGGSIKLAAASLSTIPRGASLFVQLPAPARIVDSLEGLNGVDLTPGPETADYVLAGRLAGKQLEYACFRPLVDSIHREQSVLPVRTAWLDVSRAYLLRDRIVRLHLVQGWQDLRSPGGVTSRYRLAIRRATDGGLVDDGKLLGNHSYDLVLRQRERSPSEPVFARYVYVFAVANDGSSVLLFPPPDAGTVENLLPITPTPAQPLSDAPAEIPLSGTRPLIVDEPYGVDTYFLLSTDEPLPSLSGFEWKGVRGARGKTKKTPLEDLLERRFSGTRGPEEPIRTPPNWTIDKEVFTSIPPRGDGR